MREGRLIKGLNRFKMLFTPPNARDITRFQYAITYLCNSRCLTCNIWELYRRSPELLKEELSLEEIKDIFPRINYLKKVKQISLTGGEPFLRADFVDIYLFFASYYRNSSLYIVSNGLDKKLILEKVKMIKEKEDLSRLKLGISLDGGEEIHDEIRGVKGSFKKVIELAEEIKNSFPEIELNFSFTISEKNFQDIKEVYRIAKEYNALFSLRFAQVSESYYQNEGMDFSFKEDELLEIEEIIREIVFDMYRRQNLLEKLFRLDVYFLNRLVRYQRYKERLFYCCSGIHSFFLDPYGKVYPCINLSDVYGSLKEDEFNHFWLSLKAKDIRLKIKRGECHCWTECETIPSLQRNPVPLLYNLFYFISKSLRRG